MGMFDLLGNAANSLRGFASAASTLLTNKTSYQQNLATSSPQEEITTRGTLGRIANILKTDLQQGQSLFEQFQQFQNDPSTPYYNPFLQATNPSIQTLANLGFDVSNIDDKWFEDNAYLMNYYETSNTTNNVKAPTKKSSTLNQAAYAYNQLWDARETSNKALQELNAAMEEAATLAQMSDRNYSDDQIVEMVYGNEKKYPTLAKMEKSKLSGEPIELNFAVPYSKDALYGAVWMGRNPDYKGDLNGAMANSYNGVDNVWKEDPEVRERLENSPYSLGSTMDGMRIYYNQPSFDQQWVDDNRWRLNSKDKTDRDNYIHVAEVVEKTADMKKQADSLHKKLNERLKIANNPEDVMKDVDSWLGSSEFNLLADMDKSIKRGYYTKDLKYVETSEAVDYSRNDVEKYVRDYFAKKEGKKSGTETLSNLKMASPDSRTTDEKVPETVEGDLLTEETVNRRVTSVESKLYDSMADTEKRFLSASPLMYGQQLSDSFYKAKQGTLIQGPANPALSDPAWVAKMATKQAEDAEKSYVDTNLSSLQFRTDYEKKRDERDALQEQLNQQEAKYSEQMLSTKDIPQQAEVEIDPYTGFTLYFEMDENGKYIPDIDMENPGVIDYMVTHNLTEEQFLKDAQDRAKSLDNYAESIQQAKKKYPTLSAEDISQLPTEQDMNALRANITKLDRELVAGLNEYNEKTREVELANNRRNRIGDITLRNSGMAVDPAVADDAINYISSFSDWKTPDSTYDGVIEELDQLYGNIEALTNDQLKELNGHIESLTQDANTVRYMADYFANIPAGYKEKMLECADWLDSRRRLYDAFLLKQRKDFKTLAQEGRDLAEHNMEVNSVVGERPTDGSASKMGFLLMDPDEMDIYYALYALKGVEAADQMYFDLEGSLLQRAETNFRENARESAESGFLGRVLNEGFSIASAGVEPILNFVYLANAAITGKDNKWLRLPSKNAQAAMSAVNNELSEKYKGTVWGTVLPKLAQTINDRARSAFAGSLYGGFLPEGASDIVHAIPISLIAGGEAYEKAIDNDLEPWKAWSLAAVNFACESVFEGIKYGNYKSAFPDGKINLKSFKDFFLDKIKGLDWLEEGTGETATNIVERIFDDWISGDQSERNKAIQAYIDAGVVNSVEDAELLVMTDFFKEDLETFVTSSLSTFLDVVPFTAGKGLSALHYARQANAINKQTGSHVTARALMNRDVQMVKSAQELQERAANRDLRPFFSNEAKNESNGPEYVSEGRRGENDAEYDVDITILDNSFDSNRTTQTSTIGAVLRVNDMNSHQANAAAIAFANETGEDSIAVLEDMLQGGQRAGINIGTLKMGIQYAMLADGRCREVMNSPEFQGSSGRGKAEMLAAAVMADATNESVHSEVNDAVHGYRVNAAEQEMMAEEGIQEKLDVAQDAADDAAHKARKAEGELEETRGQLDAARQNAQDAINELLNNPLDTSAIGPVQQTAERVSGLEDDVKEGEQAVADAQQKRKDAEQEAKRTNEGVMADIRQRAEGKVSQEETQEAAQAKLDAEIREKAIAAERENRNFSRLDAEEFVRQNFPNLSPEDQEYALKRVMGIQMALSQTSDSIMARGRFADAFAKKYGLKREYVEDAFFNAKIDPKTGTLTINKNASQSDIIYAVLIHEITHIAESSDTYYDLADAVLQMRYGEGMTFKGILSQMESGDVSSRLAQDILSRKALYDETLTKQKGKKYDLTNLEALQEIVADGVGYVIAGDQAAIDQLVAEKPSLARRILDSIKSFLKKAVGIEDETITQAQKVVGMLEESLKNNNANDNMSQRYQLMEFEDGKRFVDLSIDQDLFDGLSLSEMKELSKKYIKDHFKDLVIGIDNKAFVNGKSAEEYYYTHGFNNSPDTLEAKARASTEIDNLMDAGVYDGHDNDGRDGHAHKNYPGGFDYYKTIIKSGDQYYEALISIGKTKHGDKFHSVSDIKNITQEIMDSYGDDPKFHFLRDISMQNVAQDRRNVNTIAKDDNGTPLAEELSGGTVAADISVPDESPDGERYSLSSWTPTEASKVRANLLKNGFTAQQADKWIADVNSIAAVIAADKERLDFTPDRTQKFKKPNGDVYKWTLDASTLCAKRLLYQGTFNAIQKLMPNTPLYAGDLIELSNMMREMGYQTPCGICYVESQRRDTGKFTEQYLEKYSKEHEGEFIPTYADLTTSDGLYKLRDEHPEVYIKANNARGSASTKPVQLRTDYRGDVRSLTKDSIEYLKSIGGLRIQSFSDFETPHLMDMMQAVLDMAAVKLTSQAYTKVPNFAWVFGDTGIKINLSLMGEGTGVDENGNLIFSSIEGMDFDEAMKLRDRYSQNVGTILVGMNDAHILAAMADPRIDFIIPFHRSGWSEENRQKMTSLANYKDYQDYQNERDIKTGKKADSNLEPVGPNGYWDYNKAGKENAEEYLRLCAEKGLIPKFEQFLVNNGDGSYSLQPDGSTDGYWKTLIDFKMYDNDGVGAPQQEVTPNINMAEAYRVLGEFDGTGVNSLPVADPVVERYVDEYKANHPRERYSLPAVRPSDAPYMNAVDRGDMGTAQRMVDERAEENGYDVQYAVWRGDSQPYTVLEPGENGGNLGTGLYFTPSLPYAERFASEGSPVRKFYLKKGNTFDYDEFTQEFNDYLTSWLGENDMDQDAYIDEETWSAIWDDFINENDYDSVKATGVGGRAYGASEIAVQNSWQAKLADPVTYDDNGNVIPLSERFNDQEEDIRYSLPSDDILDQRIQQYFADLAEQTNLHDQAQPVDDGSAQRQFGSRTAQQSDALHQEVKDYLFSHSSYTPDSNQAQIDRAMDWVQGRATANDPDGYQAALNEVTSEAFDYRSADGQARMLTVMGMAALKNDLNAELRLADAYNKQGTDLGRQLQARKIFRMMTPIGRQSVLQQEVDQINEQYAREGITTRVGLPDYIFEAAGAAQTEEEFQRVRRAAARELASQMPANWKDKLRGWRMLAMLGNPRTHIRNVIGNALFIPAVSLKNKMGAIGEMISGQDQRTKTLTPILPKEIRDFARQDAVAMKDTLTGEAKYNEDSMVDRERKTFRGLLQTLSDFNSNALEAEDWFFLKGHYRRALGGWMQANGYTPEQLRSNPALLEQGRAYAIQEAQKATYRDFNQLASTLNQVSRNGGVAGFLVEAALPFKKTPANILKRGLEYSIVGTVKALTADARHLKQYMDYQNGKLETLPEKAISPNQFIDNLCSGLTGTAIMAVGAILSSMGVVSCGLDDDDDEFEKAKGNQKYSIKFSLFGQDVTFTMDWAAPMSMPFFVGAAIQEQYAKEGEVDLNGLINSIGKISEPVFNLSMLDGMNSLFKTSQYDDTNSITQILAKLGLNYATSFVPSLLGATARAIDPYRRKSFVESGQGTGPLGTARYTLEQTENKIPWLSQTNIPYRDVWGNPETSGVAERILENFVLPGYISEYKDDPVINELGRLYEATGEKAMIPSDPDKTINFNKEKYILTDKQWDAYKEARGKTAHELLTGLLDNPEYLKASEKVQAEMVKSAWSYADQVGKKAAVPEYEVEDIGNDPVAAIANDGAITGYKAEMMKALKAGDMETYLTTVEALHEAGAEDSTIKNQIANTYRDLYKDAYRKGRYDEMAEIENLLYATGFDFDTAAWEKAVDEKYGRP